MAEATGTTPSSFRSGLTAALQAAEPLPVVRPTSSFLTADSKDLQSECSQFHEFAREELQDDDWIRCEDQSVKPKLTIDDTLRKEYAIRKIGKEAEEEAELEEQEDEEEEDASDDEEEDEEEDEDALDDDEDDDDDDDDDDDEDEDDDDDIPDRNVAGRALATSKYAWDDAPSDGYNTDSEGGFAESDDEDDGLMLWTTGITGLGLPGPSPIHRRTSVAQQSDSSICSRRSSRTRVKRHRKASALDIRPGTPDLPDSTDFVCGTLDEDRPLEEAYISRMAARRQGKFVPIPQDIDPSFPASEPEDEGEELHRRPYGESDDQLWIHGELEDLHSERDGRGRKKSAMSSPKRCRSPPPKRARHSPAPKARGRSDRRVFDAPSPRRFKSPAPPQMMSTSPGSPESGEGIAFRSLAFRPGLAFTKSLPRGPSMFAHLKARKAKAEVVAEDSKDNHIRGAIDIVKGLEQKRQRRKEKFYQKYCNRSRKEKAQVKRPPPGQGAQRMREVGLIMAGKMGQGNYVLSV